VGVGLTNACDLAGSYRETARVASSQGGCAGPRELPGGVERADPYCPFVRGDGLALDWAPSAGRELLKTGSACTTVVAVA